MNIKDFLIENYIWILVVLLLTIVTIIGFLADKKKNDKKEKVSKNKQEQPMTNGMPQANQMNYQPVQGMQTPINYQPEGFNNQNQVGQPMGGPVNFGQPLNTTVQPVNQLINQMTQPVNQPVPTTQTINQIPDSISYNNVVPNINQMNNPQPVETITSVSSMPSEPMYQPLSEQKPNIPPRDIMASYPNNETLTSIPVPTMNPEPMPNFLGGNAPQEIAVNQVPNYMNNQNPEISQSQTANYKIPSGLEQPMSNQFNNYQQPVGNVVPQPVPVPSPEPVNTIPNPVTEPTPVMSQPINFVYGPTQNGNNQNM